VIRTTEGGVTRQQGTYTRYDARGQAIWQVSPEAIALPANLADLEQYPDLLNEVVEFSPFELLDRLADLVPRPQTHRHRYHGVFAPNHKLRSAVTALAIANVGKLRDAATGGRAVGGHAAGQDTTGDCCDLRDKPRSHDTSRIAWAKLMARVGEEFPLECPGCGGDIRLIAFITEPGPIRKVLTHLGEPLEPPPVSPARGPPTDWGELVQVHDDRAIFQASPVELPDIDIHSL